MSSVILCRRNQAQTPYELEELSLHLYNLEEISYFIQENIDLAQPSFMRQSFLEWVTKELAMPSLAQRMELYWRRKNVALFMESLLQASGYHTPSEISMICSTIEEFQKKNPVERKKMRADRMLKKHLYVAAIQEYRKILLLSETKEEKPVFQSQVWNNLGTAYAGIFLFEDAMHCFEMASTYQDTSQIGQEYWASCFLAYGEEKTRSLMEEAKYASDQIEAFLKDQNSREQLVEDAQMQQLYELREKGEINAFYEQADTIMAAWKNEYMQKCVF
ncbi:MAG: hypothetical protein ACI4HI_07125 [Lachnospiraceae bacterium]